MLKKLFLSGFLLVLSCWLLATRTKAFDVPSYEGFINDYAEILSPDFENQLEAELQTTAEASDGAEIAVATITTLDGDTVENVAQKIFDTWQIGKKHLDNGVLLLVAVEDKKLRIHNGYGVEPVITDAEAGRIIRNVITPEFKQNDYEAGIRQGVAAIQQQFSESPGFAPGIDPINKSGIMSVFSNVLKVTIGGIFMVVIFSYLAAWMGRSKIWWPGGLVGLGVGFLLTGMVTAVFFGLVGLLLDYILSKNYKKLKKAKKSTSWKSTWGGFKTHSSSGSSFGSSSSSGSSFGGGSSGGGGASGGW